MCLWTRALGCPEAWAYLGYYNIVTEMDVRTFKCSLIYNTVDDAFHLSPHWNSLMPEPGTTDNHIPTFGEADNSQRE